jgi:DNA-binding NarL/FixJ family response regulator
MLGDERSARDAVTVLLRLGADAAVRAFTRERAARGARAVRGPRRTTVANAAGLTRREQEVLERLAQGLTNAGIAQALTLSERTVAHHVSAILGKVGASTRRCKRAGSRIARRGDRCHRRRCPQRDAAARARWAGPRSNLGSSADVSPRGGT